MSKKRNFVGFPCGFCWIETDTQTHTPEKESRPDTAAWASSFPEVLYQLCCHGFPLLKATSRGLLTRGAAACHTRQLTRPIRGAALRVTRGAAACHTRQLEAIIPPHCRADCAAAACEQYHNKQQWRYCTVYTGNSVMLQAAFSAWSEKIDRNREIDGGGGRQRVKETGEQC